MRYLIPVLAFTLMPTLILSVSSPSYACSRPAPTGSSGGDGANCKPPKPHAFLPVFGVSGVQSAIALNPQPEPPGRSIKPLSNVIAINPQPLPPEKRR